MHYGVIFDLNPTSPKLFLSNAYFNVNLYFLKQISTFEFVHRRFNSTAQHVNGMNEIYQMIEELQFTNSVFPITQQYANWETDAVSFFLKIFFPY